MIEILAQTIADNQEIFAGAALIILGLASIVLYSIVVAGDDDKWR